MKSRSSLWMVAVLLILAVVLVSCGSRFLAGGKLHFSQNRFDRALENFQKAAEEEPNNGEVHLWVGRALAELERDEEAVVEIRRAEELDPVQAEMVKNTLVSYWSKRYNSALTYAQEASEKSEEEQPAILEKAQERFARAIIYAPDSVQNYSNLGKVLYQLGRMDEAMEMFEKSRLMSAGRPDLQRFLFALYKFFGDQSLQKGGKENFEQALALLHKAEAVPASPEDMLEVHYNIATAYYGLADLVDEGQKTQMLDKAAEYFAKVLEVNPEEPDALETIAYVYADRGMYPEAIQRGKQRFDQMPWDPDVNLLMHRLYKAAGDDKMANGHILVRQILADGARQDAGAARAEAQAAGPNSDALKVLRDRGMPRDVRTIQVGQGVYSAWFYWGEGRIFLFREGKEQARITFKAISEEQIQEIMG
jgi:tetratricopeptide (TPR) repeat protein